MRSPRESTDGEGFTRRRQSFPLAQVLDMRRAYPPLRLTHVDVSLRVVTSVGRCVETSVRQVQGLHRAEEGAERLEAASERKQEPGFATKEGSMFDMRSYWSR